MTKGKERIRFDCTGEFNEPHIYKCSECDHEFRGTIGGNEKRELQLNCPECAIEETIISQPTQFEVVGVIENAS
ncbi:MULTISPECIES: hypothetical protein [Bacillales]|uniref:hypothetical protein n=1 Tax=Bacillales TaxID=1385 RepID=UPI0018835EB3|nr:MULTISPECIES: hypothetical protein [Bacillaceae]MBF0706910.1 hypothetical protein [Pseudalkalibacillus hwajinpoensis]MDO6656737.1 hypothetical protein [Anaerobacillus sp. 1_MG-2023]